MNGERTNKLHQALKVTALVVSVTINDSRPEQIYLVRKRIVL